MNPDQTRSSLIWVHTVCKNDFKNHKQIIRQMTIVVIGALRVNGKFHCLFFSYGPFVNVRNIYIGSENYITFKFDKLH